MRIYVDLDNVLVNPVLLDRGRVRIDPRPGADRFLAALARHGRLCLLTASNPYHAHHGLKALGSAGGLFAHAITRRELAPIEEQLRVVLGANVGEEERARLWSSIQPLAAPGVVFDDYPAGSGMYLLKATAVGIGPGHWIQVEAFNGQPDRDGLAKAYEEFKLRFLPARRRVTA